MAEDPEKRSKQKKSPAFSAKMTGENGSDSDLPGLSGRKKSRPPKGAVASNSGSIQSIQTASVTPASKTVAAILKQAKDHKPTREQQPVQRMQQLQQQNTATRKKAKAGPVTTSLEQKSIGSSQLLTQLSMASPLSGGTLLAGEVGLGRIGLSNTVSQIVPVSTASGLPRGVAPMNKDKITPATTKASSLSRELSPSRITAQMVKVMADTPNTTISTNTIALTPNLLRSALQGNMPDPMGMLNTAKQDSSVVPCAALTLSKSSHSSSSSTSSLSSTDTVLYGSYNNSPSTSLNSNPAHSFNNSSSSNSIHSSQPQKQSQHSSLNKILTSLAGSPEFEDHTAMVASTSGTILQHTHPQQAQSQHFQLMSMQDCDLEDLPSPQTATPAVENPLAASSCTIQTVNVSHIPRSSTSGSSSGGPVLGSAYHLHGVATSNPGRQHQTASRSAMEVAQQIKMEANGQRSGANMAVLKPNMSKQLRTQLQGSVNLDVQLASPTGAIASGVGTNKSRLLGSAQHIVVKKSSAKDVEQPKSLEASMPLLAAKLAPASTLMSTVKGTASATSLPQARAAQSVSALSQAKNLVGKQLLASSTSHSSSSLSLINQRQRQQQQQQLYRQQQMQQQQQEASLLQQQVSACVSEVKSPKEAWLGQVQQPLLQQQIQGSRLTNNCPKVQPQQQPQPPPPPLNLSGGLGEILVGLDKKQALEKLLQASINSSLAERAVQLQQQQHQQDEEELYHNLNLQQLLTAPTSVTDTFHKSGASLSSLIMAASSQSSSLPVSSSSSSSQMSSAMQALVDRLTNEFPKHAVKGQSQKGVPVSSPSQVLSSSSPAAQSFPTSGLQATSSALGLGHSQQTAIDVDMDMDIGQLASIAGSGGEDTGLFHKMQAQSLQQTTFTASAPEQSAHMSSSVLISSVPALTSVSSVLSAPKTISQTLTYNPPPPYPSKPNQNFVVQEQRLMNKFSPGSATIGTTTAGKRVVENPFTFPTTGVTVHPSFLSYSLTPSSSVNSQSNNVVNSSHNTVTIKDNGSTCTNGAEPSPQTLARSVGAQQQVNHFVEPLATVAASLTQTSLQARPTTDTLRQKAKPHVIPNSLSSSLSCSSSSLQSSFSNNLNQRPVLSNSKEACTLGEVKKAEGLVPISVQPFNQRISNLSCFPVINPSYRAAYRSHSVAVQRARSGVITNIAKSLDILRQNLQRSINKEISEIINRYSDKYFQPALENIRLNNNNDFSGVEHLNYVCRQILEEAKSEYMPEIGRRSVTPSDLADNVSETGSLSGRRVQMLKRGRISDSDSEKGSDGGFKRKVAKKKGKTTFTTSGRVTPSKTYKSGDLVKREGAKWDPARLKPDTLFVMGARANKALGLGNTRGRLYIRHPDVFKYIGDADDKSWLCDNNLMPTTGGKAYMLMLQDIEDLSKTDDYKDSPALMMHECVGFTVPEWMLVKMKEQMNSMRSDGPRTTTSISYNTPPEEHDIKPKILPFSAFTTHVLKEETLVSPADTEDMNFLSTADNENTQLSHVISPFNVGAAGFEDAAVSPSPSDLETADADNSYPNFLM